MLPLMSLTELDRQRARLRAAARQHRVFELDRPKGRRAELGEDAAAGLRARGEGVEFEGHVGDEAGYHLAPRSWRKPVIARNLGRSRTTYQKKENGMRYHDIV